MKKIYEKAKKVIIWLGQESNDSSYAMQVMNSIDRRWSTFVLQPANERGIPAPAIDERAFRAISQLLCRPYWRRVWIIQEATCPNDTYLRCGKDYTELWAAVATVNFVMQRTIQQAFQQDFNYPDISKYFSRVIDLDQVRLARRRSGHGLDFLSLLSGSRTCKASDPRDQIFALSGLAIDAQREAGNPDYDMSVDEVYMRFAYSMIESERTLDILGFCQAAARKPQSWSSFKLLHSSVIPKRTLPSWTPDWTLRLQTLPFTKNETPNDTSTNRLYEASDSYSPSIQQVQHLRTLIVRGSTFDTVSKLSESFGHRVSQSIIELWQSWAETELGSTYHQTETTKEAFDRTLVAGMRSAEGPFLRGPVTRGPIPKKHDNADVLDLSAMVGIALEGRGFFLSKQGYMGLARFDVTEGDTICILHGGQVPFILRQDGKNHLFKGECYVHGLMDGEGMRYPTIWQDFRLS